MTTPTAAAPISTSVPSTGNRSFWTVAWTGGWEDPSFQSFTDEAAARAQYDTWVADTGEGSDRVTIIETVIAPDGSCTTIKIDEHCPAWQESPEDVDG